MKRLALAASSLFALTACTTSIEIERDFAVPGGSAVDALNAYYATVPDTDLPSGPTYVKLDESKALTKIFVGSCHDEEREDASMATMASEGADAFLFVGDNVYGDRDGRLYANFDLELEEVRESYTDLANDPVYQKLAANTPVLATWDDHDFGMNDFGGDFAGKVLSERIFEQFYDLQDSEAAARPGIYRSYMVGPEGQQTQIIMLDTRFFRSELTRTDDWGAPGKQRYLASEAPDQDMLGDAQWAWLEEELKKPADLRLLVTSIQVIPDVHGWEAWRQLPAERDRLYRLIEKTNAEGLVFVSGDRHTAFLYKDADRGAYPFYEITASSMNVAFASEPDSKEVDERQIGLGYAWSNFGQIDIDWQGRQLTFSIRSETGETVRRQAISFDEIGAG